MGCIEIDVAAALPDVERHVPAWRDLETRSIEDNLYSTSDYVLPLLRHYDGRDLRVVFAYTRDVPRRLVGVAAFRLLLPSATVPLRRLVLFLGPHGNLSHPLLDRDEGAAAAAGIWDWIDRPGQPWRLVLFEQTLAGSPAWAALESEIVRRGRPFWVKHEYARAVLARRENFDAYLRTLPASRRKGYRRRLRQLQQAGQVEVRLHRDLRETPDLAERFLALEQKGWKGLEGTAMAHRPTDARFFREITAAFGARGQIFFVEVLLDGIPVAMTTNFICGNTLFAFKGAFDPAYDAYSPGIVAEVEGVRLFHESTSLARGDGGNTEGSYLLSYWRERETIRNVLVATHHLSGRAYVHAAPFVRQAVRRLRGLSAAPSADEPADPDGD